MRIRLDDDIPDSHRGASNIVEKRSANESVNFFRHMQKLLNNNFKPEDTLADINKLIDGVIDRIKPKGE